MTVKIQSHPRGLIISMQQGPSRHALVKLIEDRMGSEHLRFYKGGVIVPKTFAADTLELFDPEHNIWEEDSLAIARNLARHKHLQILAKIEVAEALDEPYSKLAESKFLNRLDEHQIVAAAAICAPSLRGLAIFDEQGTGKTMMALAGFDRLREMGLVKKLLVVAPKSVLASWRTECQNLFGKRYSASLVTGALSQRRQIIRQFHDVLLLSYDTLARDIGLLKVWMAAEPNRYMLVVDESYFVKNPNTLRAKAIAEIRPFCERVIILCGTPAPNSPSDIVNQVNIADGGIAFAGQQISDDPKQAESQISRALDQFIYLRRLKEDVFPGIPAKAIEKISLDLQPIQRALYDKAHDDLVVAVRSVDDREFQRQLSSFIARRVALLQICSHPRSLDPLYSEDPAKLLALDRLLTDLVERQGKKVVIWSFFRHSLQAISDRYQHYGIARIDGSVADIEARVDAIRRFQNNPETRIFVGNAASAGAGITLTAAHHAIYESFSNQAAHYMQSVDRIHRRGQTHDVTYHILIAEDTIEEREFERLRQKERASRNLLGDQYKEPITRERFLADLGEIHVV